jgi:hypothetical protein
MKVISVRQPWAWAIVSGGKDVENRNWPTKIRGRVAIHAGKTFDLNLDELTIMTNGEYGEPFTSMIRNYPRDYSEIDGPVSKIIGTVEIYDCVPAEKCFSLWKASGVDHYCWLLRNPVALREPIPMKGQLGFWDVSNELFSGGES